MKKKSRNLFSLLTSFCPTFISRTLIFFSSSFSVRFYFALYEPQYNVLISLGGKIQFLISDFVIVSLMLLPTFQPVSSSSTLKCPHFFSHSLAEIFLLLTLKCITKYCGPSGCWNSSFVSAISVNKILWSNEPLDEMSPTLGNQDIIWKSITFLLALI